MESSLFSEFLYSLIAALVQYPEDIRIEETSDAIGTLFFISVHPDDIRILIGRQGKTIDALRCVVRIAGSKQGKRMTLRIKE